MRVQEQVDVAALARRPRTSSRAPPVPRRSLRAEHDEERRAQMHRGVLQRAHHFGRDDVAGDAHDEQLAEVRIEQSSGGTRESLQPMMVA